MSQIDWTNDPSRLTPKQPQPQSRLLRNCFIIAVVLTGAIVWGWISYTNSPDYLARGELDMAEKLVESGKLAEATEVYRNVVYRNTDHTSEAIARIVAIMEGPLNDASPVEAKRILRVVLNMVAAKQISADYAKPFEHGMRVADKFKDYQPKLAIEILQVVEPLAPDRDTLLNQYAILLNQVVLAEPNAVDPAVQLAVVYDQLGQLDKCEALLAGHEAKLGTGEGARILGQIYFRKGDYDRGEALLDGYVTGRLKTLHQLEKEYDAELNSSRESAINRLQTGDVSSELNARLDAADEETQIQLVNEFIRSELENNPVLLDVQQQLFETASVVPVAMELGIGLLQRGRQTEDPAQRKETLERAEKLFLDVRGFVSESNEYQLSLGEIYYWLGKAEEGRKLLDEFLDQNQRGFESLYGVANLLRNLGVRSEAMTLCEEAYSVAREENQKHTAAMLLGIMSDEPKDAINWLRKADTKLPQVKATLAKNEAFQAAQDGRIKDAATHLRTAIAFYDTELETVSALNNVATLYRNLYSFTGDPSALNRYGELMDKANKLMPNDAVVLANTLDATLSKGIRELAGDRVDFSKLKIVGDVDLLEFLYSSSEQHAKLVEQFQTNPTVTRGLSILDQLQVIAPKRLDTYATMASIGGFLQDSKSLNRTLQQFTDASPETTQKYEEARAYVAGEKDDYFRNSYSVAIQQARETYQAMSSLKPDTTLSIAAVTLCRYLTAVEDLGLDVDADEVVQLAQSAHAAAPSVSTRENLIYALVYRLCTRLSAKDSRFANLVTSCKRESSSNYAVALAMAISPSFAENTAADSDMQRAIELIAEGFENFPEGSGAWDCVVVQASNPQLAKKMAAYVGNHPSYIVQQQLDEVLNPYPSLWKLIRKYMLAKMLDEPNADELLGELGERLPLQEWLEGDSD